MDRALKTTLAGLTVLVILGGCSSSKTSSLTYADHRPQVYSASAIEAQASTGHVLAAADGLGAQVFGDEEARVRLARLRNAGEAFARAEAEAQPYQGQTTDSVYATVPTDE